MDPLAKHIRDIVKPAFARHGFAQADVVAHWPEIVGADLALVSAPERIRWPRGAGEEAQKGGGTLFVRAAPGRALELQYEATRIIGRVNSFFGYGAIAKLKIVQDSQPFRSPAPARMLADKPVCEQALGQIEEGPLKSALERLGRGVAASRPSSPQGK